MNRTSIILILVVITLILASCQTDGTKKQFYAQLEVTIPPEEHTFRAENEIELAAPETLSFVETFSGRRCEILCHKNMLLVFDRNSRLLKIYDLNSEKKIQEHKIPGEMTLRMKSTKTDAFVISSEYIFRISDNGGIEKFDNYYQAGTLTGNSNNLFALSVFSRNKLVVTEIIKMDFDLKILERTQIDKGSNKNSGVRRWGSEILADDQHIYLLKKHFNKIIRYDLDGKLSGSTELIPSEALDKRVEFNRTQIINSERALHGSQIIMISVANKLEFMGRDFCSLLFNPENNHRFLVFQPGQEYKVYRFPEPDSFNAGSFSCSLQSHKLYLMDSIGNHQYQIITFNLE